MRRLLMLTLFALTTMNTQLKGMWMPATLMSAASYVGQTVFPYFMAMRLATKEASSSKVTVNNSPGAVVNNFNNCTFNNSSVVSGNIGNDALSKISANMQGVAQIVSEKKRTMGYVMISLIGGIYVYTNCVLYQLMQTLHLPECWSLWKHNITLEQLKEMACDELMHEVKRDAKRRYDLAQEWQLLDCIMQEMNEECAALDSYEAIAYYLDYLLIPEQFMVTRFREAAIGFSGHNEQAAVHINTAFTYLTVRKLFIIDDALLSQCILRKERLLFLKNLLEGKQP